MDSTVVSQDVISSSSVYIEMNEGQGNLGGREVDRVENNGEVITGNEKSKRFSATPYFSIVTIIAGATLVVNGVFEVFRWVSLFKAMISPESLDYPEIAGFGVASASTVPCMTLVASLSCFTKCGLPRRVALCGQCKININPIVFIAALVFAFNIAILNKLSVSNVFESEVSSLDDFSRFKYMVPYTAVPNLICSFLLFAASMFPSANEPF